MKLTKKLIVTLLTLALLAGCIPTCAMDVQAAAKVPKKLICYLAQTPYYGAICIDRWHKIPKSSIKSSNTDVAEIKGSGKAQGSSSSPYVSSGKWNYIDLMVKKPGTTTISFKMDGKKYQTKIYAKKYINPIKLITITGVKNGNKTNLANLTDETVNSTKIKLQKTVKNPKINITTKNGWKIQSFSYQTAAYQKNKTGFSEPKDSGWKSYKKPVSKVGAKVFNKTKVLKKNAGGYTIWVNCVNTKDNAGISLIYNIDKEPLN